MNEPRLSISIVSHGQGALVEPLLKDLSSADFRGFASVELFVTLNLPEDESFLSACDLAYRVIRNPRPIGFGANHNQAFACSDCDYFLVLNPDIRLGSLLFGDLLDHGRDGFGVMAPRVVSSMGEVEDSCRRYPTISRVLKRVGFSKSTADYPQSASNIIEVDWIAGMFMLFDSEAFKRVAGFDTRYFMYLEDADICRRLNRCGLSVLYDSSQKIVHDAQRNSFKNGQHFKWHLRSMVRFIVGI
jgi:N-acetylglucosaminyl-diphospho-decaprenol L-rhamnosyltransferase